MADVNPLFNANHPPLLSQVNVDQIYSNPIVIGPEDPVEQALLAIYPWRWLSNFGGRPIYIVSGLYMGIVAPSGSVIMNPDGPKPLVNADTPVLVLANVRKRREWHLMGAPYTCSTDKTIEVAETFSTELSVMRSFESTLELSIEASASASGFGMAASVTTGLRETVSEGIQQQSTVSESRETKVSKTVHAGKTYAYWDLFERVEIEYIMRAVGSWNPMTDEQMASINPGRQAYFAFLYDRDDFCDTSALPGG